MEYLRIRHTRNIEREAVRREVITRCARLMIVLLVVLILTALFLGRRLQQSYPFLISIVSFSEILIALGITSIGVSSYWNNSPQRYSRTLITSALPLLASIAVAIVACEAIILLPIERIHFLKYALLSGLIPIAREGAQRRDVGAYLSGFLIAASVGSLEECAQAFIPERFFDLRDIWLNITGALFGTVISSLIPRAINPR